MKGSSRMGFQSTGDDAKDLAMLRAAKNIDDGPVSMKRGGKVKKKSKSRVRKEMRGKARRPTIVLT